MKKETVNDRKKRIIARGEHSNHCHTVCGNATVVEEGGEVYINVEDSTAVLKHLMETHYVKEGKEVWTKDHHDLPLTNWKRGEKFRRQGDVGIMKVGAKKFKYIAQKELDMNTLQLRNVED